MKKIVLIGGGSGISPLLAELNKKRDTEVSAIVTVFDNGGSSGILRQQFDILAVGDFRKCVSATAGEMAKFFEQREQGHALGNLILSNLIREQGTEKAFEIFAKFGVAKVMPVSFSNSHIVAELENKEKIVGEEKLDNPPQEFINQKITKISLQPVAQLNTQVEKLFQQADELIVGPGSLFGSLLVHFEVAGFREAFTKSSAKKILIMNVNKEFGCMQDSDKEIVERFGVKFDKIKSGFRV
jgi:uncharacterized cofD-like protein